MKIITHETENKEDYLDQEDRYYWNKKLLLVVKNPITSPNINECVNIGGNSYVVEDIVNYPEILIVEYGLVDVDSPTVKNGLV